MGIGQVGTAPDIRKGSAFLVPFPSRVRRRIASKSSSVSMAKVIRERKLNHCSFEYLNTAAKINEIM